MMNIQDTAGEYVEDITQPALIYSAGGVAVASLLGVGMTLIPFYKVPAGNVIRTGTLLGVGAYVYNRSKVTMGPKSEALAMAGGLVFTAGAIQVLGYAANVVESTTGMTVPFLGSVGKLLSPASAVAGAEADMSILPQQGMGSVIGQQTATHSYSDIRSAEDNVSADWSFENMNQDMVDRYAPGDVMDSIMEMPALGHGVTQNFGAEVADTTNAVRPHTDMVEFQHKANTMGVRSLDPFAKANPFVESVHPTTPSYQPPVWYAEDEPSMEMTEGTPTPEVGGMHDVLSTYIMPSHTMSTAGNSGHGVEAWFGAESSHTGHLSRHVSGAEGFGSVIGQ